MNIFRAGIKLLLMMYVLIHTSHAQDPPVVLADIIPQEGSTLIPRVYQGINYSSIESPSLSNGFTVNLSGTQRMELDVDISTGNNTENGQLMFSLNNMVNISLLQSAALHRTNLMFSDISQPGIPVEVVVYSEQLPEQHFIVPQGSIGSFVRYFHQPVLPGTAEVAPFLTAIKAIPYMGSKVAFTIDFHEPITYTLNSSVISDVHALTFILNVNYPLLNTFKLVSNQIPDGLGILDHVKMPMLPAVYSLSLLAAEPGTVLNITGNNLRYTKRISMGGVDMRMTSYINTNNIQVQVPLMPPGSYVLLVENDYGIVTAPPFTVLPELVCKSRPASEVVYFYFAPGNVLTTVFKWQYPAGIPATFDVRYKEQNAPVWSSLNGLLTKETSIGGLIAGSTYDFQVRAVCSNGIASEWSAVTTLAIKYTEDISVSPAMHGALQDWSQTAVPAAMDVFLNGYTPALDLREVASVLDRFFEGTSSLFPYDLFGPRKVSCMCKTISPQMNIDLTLYEAEQDQPHVFAEDPRQNGFQVGNISGRFGYRGAAHFLKARAIDFRSNSGGNRRHTRSGNALNRREENGNASGQTNPQSQATMVISYLCANSTSKMPSICGCNKDLSVIAQIKASTCVDANSDCFGGVQGVGLHPKKGGGKENGVRAESGFGGIILTGTIYKNNNPLTVRSIRVLNAEQFGRFRHKEISNPLDTSVVSSGLNLLFVGIKAALKFPESLLTLLYDNGTMNQVKSDLQTILTRPLRQQIVLADAGVNGCQHVTLNQPGVEYLMSIAPGETKFVTVASTSFAQVKAYGCTYDASAHNDVRYYLAAANRKYGLSDSPTCCVNSRAVFATRSIDQNDLKQRPGDKEDIEKFLYKYGDKIGVNSVGTPFTWWYRADAVPAIDKPIVGKIDPWFLFDEPAGILVGRYLCKPELLKDSVLISWPMIVGKMVVKVEWDPGVAKYKTGYQLEKSTDGVTFTTTGPAIHKDSIRYSDTLDVGLSTIYYRLKTVHAVGNLESEYSDVIQVNFPLAKTSTFTKEMPAVEFKKLDLTIAPNSFGDHFRAIYSLPEKTTVTILVYDAAGRKVAEVVNNKKCDDGVHVQDIDASEWTSGNYYMVLTSDQGKITKQIIKQ